jgi:chromosome segregation ATPase
MNMNHVSEQKQAERLELFEDNLRLKDQLEAANAKIITQTLAHQDSLNGAADPIQYAIDILTDHQQVQNQLATTENQRDLFGSENDELRAQLNEVADAGEKLHDQVTHYKDQCEKLLAKHNSEVQKAQAEIDRIARQNALLAVEVKDLRALNPQRLQKQVKELQKKNREQQDANQVLRKSVNNGQKIRKEHEERGRVIDKLYSDNRRLDAALSEACDQLNDEDGKVKPIEEHGDWAIYAHNDGTEALILHHGPTDSSRVYWAGKGAEKTPAIPPKLKARAEAMIANYVSTRESMVDYMSGEAVKIA